VTWARCRCGHCKTLKPEWVAASEITDLPAKMTAVDCTVNPDVCRKYNAQSYPTLHYFQDKDTDKPLEGGPHSLRSAPYLRRYQTTEPASSQASARRRRSRSSCGRSSTRAMVRFS
jgi:thiol-disulfide isomerase/thioredoxin